MLHLLVLALPTLSGAASDTGAWGVGYSEPVCAVRGSTVSIPCTYTYPPSARPVRRVLWCSMNTNTGACTSGPYVCDRDSPGSPGEFKYAGDKKSNCTLLIRDVQPRHSGEYKFRFITKNDKYTGDPGAKLEVAVLKVSLTRQSESGTLKEGDSVSLTCTVNCTLSSPQLVWFKDGGRLPESGSTLHRRALTVGNSGNYSCALKNYEAFTSESVSLSVQGAASDIGAWSVRYSEPVCAVRGSTVSIPCTYSYPPSAGAVQRVLWCSMNRSSVCDERQDVCTSKPPGSSEEFIYAGDKKSNCTLLIRDVQLHHSGEYKFRFITEKNQYTGDPGATLTVTVPKVSLTRRSGSGTLKEGDSVSLTCTVDCPLSSPQLVWFKDGDRLPESGSALHLNALTVGNSGNYSCALKNYENFTSESFSLSVPGSSSNTALILVGVALVLLAVVVLAVYRKRQREKAQEDGGRGKPQVGETTQDKQTQLQTSHVTQTAKDLQGGEEMYASVCKTPKPEKRGTKETPEEDSGGSGGHGQAGVTEHAEALLHDGEVAYACVQPIQPDKGSIRSLHLPEDDAVIYSTVTTN